MMKPVLKTGRKMLWMAAIAERNMPMLLLQEKDSVKSKHPPYLREHHFQLNVTAVPSPSASEKDEKCATWNKVGAKNILASMLNSQSKKYTNNNLTPINKGKGITEKLQQKSKWKLLEDMP
jgi:hypothetical protein